MMKKILITLSLGLGLTFGVQAQAVTKAEKKAQIMHEREEAMKEPADTKALFDSKEVNLAATATAPEGTAVHAAATEAAPIVETTDKVVLKESEVPLHADAVKEKATTTSSLPRLVISLAVVFSLMGAGIFALKKWSKKRTTINSAMKIRVLTQHHLGPKKSIAIIQVAGESILVGITDHNISMLKTLALIDDEIPQGEPNKFDDALYNFEEEQGEIGQHFSQKTNRRDESPEPDDFALRGISEIRDVVSRKLKGMRQME